jgi:hypothetical protein
MVDIKKTFRVATLLFVNSVHRGYEKRRNGAGEANRRWRLTNSLLRLPPNYKQYDWGKNKS